MNDPYRFREWSSTDKLPKGFTEWLKEIVAEREVSESYWKIARALGVNPSLLSRWIAGTGPLSQDEIRKLSSELGPVVYTFLGLPRPDYNE
jgi:plasmid maintenance system antidote protein VapI